MHKAAPELELIRLQSSDAFEFSELTDLYLEVFPENERKSLDVLRSMLADAEYQFLYARENGSMVGFAILRGLSGGAALLEYMAITPPHRGRGLGRQLLSSIHSQQFTLLIEVESDRVESTERAIRTQRKQFYRSVGAREFEGMSWIMPAVSSTPPPPMEMMVLTADADATRKDQLRGWLTSIYVEVYGQSAHDPRIDAMLTPIPNSVRLL